MYVGIQSWYLIHNVFVPIFTFQISHHTYIWQYGYINYQYIWSFQQVEFLILMDGIDLYLFKQTKLQVKNTICVFLYHSEQFKYASFCADIFKNQLFTELMKCISSNGIFSWTSKWWNIWCITLFPVGILLIKTLIKNHNISVTHTIKLTVGLLYFVTSESIN